MARLGMLSGMVQGSRRIAAATAGATVVLAGAIGYAQSAKARSQTPPFPQKWVAKNAIPLRTIDPKDEEFSDLEPIGKLIGNARIVMLGEQSHGDGETLLAKCRLVKYLHQKKGFEVLTWESGRFDCTLADAALLAGEPPRQALSKGVFSIWTMSNEVQPVIEYLAAQRKGPRPLITAGFDPQLSTTEGAKALFPYLQDLLDKIDPKILTADDRTMFEENRTFFERFSKWSIEELNRRIAALDRISGELKTQARHAESVLGAKRTRYLSRLLKNVRVLLASEVTYKRGDKRSAPETNLRDRAMAENLEDLVQDEFRGKKIIVWAASFHTARKVAAIEANPAIGYRETVTMGEAFAGLSKERVYSIAFSGYEGEGGNPGAKPYRVAPAASDSFEAAAAELRKPYLFFDLKTAPARFRMRPLGHMEVIGDWRRNFDAVLFTRRLTRSTRVSSP